MIGIAMPTVQTRLHACRDRAKEKPPLGAEASEGIGGPWTWTGFDPCIHHLRLHAHTDDDTDMIFPAAALPTTSVWCLIIRA